MLLHWKKGKINQSLPAPSVFTHHLSISPSASSFAAESYRGHPVTCNLVPTMIWSEHTFSETQTQTFADKKLTLVPLVHMHANAPTQIKAWACM